MKLSLFCVLPSLLLAGCNRENAAQNPIRTDVQPIEKRLPKLGKLESIWWTSSKVTKDSFPSPPEKPAYRIQGFLQLTMEKANEFSEQFQWQKAPANWKPSLTVPNLDIGSGEWSQSDAFNKDCKPQQIPGDLYFERKKGIVYFDLEIE